MPIAPGATPNEIEARIEELVAELSLEEKIPMLSGHGFFEQIAADEGRYCAHLYHIGAGNERLGIPPLLFMYGPRGIDMGQSTCFPVSMARGASFDIDLERRRISLSLKQANEGLDPTSEDFDPALYGMAAEYDDKGNYKYPEGFDPETNEWLPGFETQREAWEAQYASAHERWEAH